MDFLSQIADNLGFTRKIEAKGNDLDIYPYHTPYSFGKENGIHLLTAMSSIMYYENVAPIFKAVNLIAEQFGAIDFQIYNKYTKEFEDDRTGILKLLKKPNIFSDGNEYKKTIAIHYLVTGNAYLLIESNDKSSEPISLNFVNPSEVSMMPSVDGYVKAYQGVINGKQAMFNRDVDFRFYADINNGYTYELIHIKDFNPRDGRLFHFGLSRLNPLYLEIEQLINSNIHNLATLKNGARPSGVMVTDNQPTAAQVEMIKTQIREFYSGAKNAGGVMILGGSDFKPLSITNKDMDFAILKKMSSTEVYNVLGIPLPLVSTESMTYSNFSESKYVLYDLVILPMFNNFCTVLTNNVLRRYKKSENLEVWYNDKAITALESRRIANDDRIIKTGVITINEGRKLLGEYEPRIDGDVYIASKQVSPYVQAPETKSINKFLESKGLLTFLDTDND